MATPKPSPRSWSRSLGQTSFIISTDPSRLSKHFINSAFAKPAMYWASPLKAPELDTIISNSCILGLYAIVPSTIPAAGQADDVSRAGHVEQIGMARIITDYVTFGYLTDVFVAEEWRGKGLAKWLIKCCREVLEGMPMLRGYTLVAGNVEQGIPFYRRELGMEPFEQGKDGQTIMHRRGEQFKVQGEDEH